MAQLATAAEGATSAEASAEAGIEALADSFVENEDNPPEEEGAEPAEEGEDETEEEAEDEESPPIDAPVSWTAEEKEAFKALPREIQETVTRRETERERFVQTKAGEAARAKDDARKEALAQVVGIEQQAAQQLAQLSAALLPQRPDPAFLRGNDQDRAYYYEQQAAYENAVAQQQQLQQAAQQRLQQAQTYQTELQKAEAAEFRQLLTEKFPEYLDPSTSAKHQQELGSIATELGYPPELIAEARAQDILAMRKAAEWKAKADKLDKLNAGKMKGVRDAKQLPKVAKPGAARTKAAMSAENRAAAFERARRTRDGGDFATVLEGMGIKL